MPFRLILHCVSVSVGRPFICPTSSAVSNRGEVKEPGLPWDSISPSRAKKIAMLESRCIYFSNEELPSMQSPNEVAAAILVQTLVDHHPQLQADIRQDQPDPKALAQVLAPFYKAMLAEMQSAST
jgi:hypothetical protein